MPPPRVAGDGALLVGRPPLERILRRDALGPEHFGDFRLRLLIRSVIDHRKGEKRRERRDHEIRLVGVNCAVRAGVTEMAQKIET